MNAPAGAIDAVVTWVDPGDPAWRAGLARHVPAGAGVEADPDGPRFRDDGLLRHCLRALDTNLPWLRRIHLVTAGHLPDWLAPDGARLRHVTHDAIFPDASHLPTFNSMAIECHLDRVPGLSETFLYVNDDVLALRPVPASLFVNETGGHALPVLRDETYPLDPRSHDTVDRSLAFTGLMLRTRFGAATPLSAIPHIPQVYDRRWLAALRDTFPEAFARTSARRFRGSDSLALRALYYNAIRAWPAAERPGFATGRDYPLRAFGAEDYRLLWGWPDTDVLRRWLQDADTADVTFLCLNGGAVAPDGIAAETCLVEDWLARRFPTPAPWERAPTP